MGDLVLVERRDDGVVVLTLNNPKVNALSRELLADLQAAAEDLTANPPGAVVVTGGDRIFAAGADIGQFGGPAEARETGAAFHSALNALAALPRFVIAAVSGYALGGGCELALACDYRIAGESARFGQPEVKIGIIPGGGGTQRFPRTVGKYKAMRYVLTGDLFGAKEANEMGLVSEIVPDAEVEKRAVAMAAQIAELAPLAIQQTKESVIRGMDASLETGLTLETRTLQMLFASKDQKEGMAAFIEKRKPKFTGR